MMWFFVVFAGSARGAELSELFQQLVSDQDAGVDTEQRWREVKDTLKASCSEGDYRSCVLGRLRLGEVCEEHNHRWCEEDYTLGLLDHGDGSVFSLWEDDQWNTVVVLPFQMKTSGDSGLWADAKRWYFLQSSDSLMMWPDVAMDYARLHRITTSKASKPTKEKLNSALGFRAGDQASVTRVDQDGRTSKWTIVVSEHSPGRLTVTRKEGTGERSTVLWGQWFDGVVEPENREVWGNGAPKGSPWARLQPQRSTVALNREWANRWFLEGGMLNHLLLRRGVPRSLSFEDGSWVSERRITLLYEGVVSCEPGSGEGKCARITYVSGRDRVVHLVVDEALHPVVEEVVMKAGVVRTVWSW